MIGWRNLAPPEEWAYRMLRTLFYIPNELLGLTLFGWGWALILWLCVSAWQLWRVWRSEGWNAECMNQLTLLLVVSVVLIWVLPKVEEVIPAGANVFPPVAAVKGIPIRGYGMMLLLGVVSGVSLATWRAKRAGLHPEVILGLAFSFVVGGLLGARLLFIFQYWHILRAPTLVETLGNLFSVDKGGLVVYGSLIGAALAFLVFTWRHRIHPLALADLIAPGMMIGLALGRIGCLLNGCCYGGTSAVPWAVTFPLDSPPYEDQKESGALYGIRLASNARGEATITAVDSHGSFAHERITPGEAIVAVNGVPTPTAEAAHELLRLSEASPRITLADGRQIAATDRALPARSLPVHPTQIYSALNALILCVVTLIFFPYRQRHGQVIALMLTLYAITRFMEERIRVDEHALVASFTISEAISLGLAVLMGVLWFYISRQPLIDMPSRAGHAS